MSSEDASPPAPAQGATAGEIRDLNAPTHAQQTGSVTFADDVGERPLEMRSTPNLADAAMDVMFEQQKQQEGGLRSWKAMRSRAVRRQLVQMSRASTSRLSNVRKLQVPSGSAAVMPHMLAPEDIDPIAGGVEPTAPTSLADTHLDAGDSTASLRSSIPSARNLKHDVEPSETFDDTHAEEIDEKEDKLAAWLQCSGLHTVGKWVLNYRKHPSCWAALLVLHGVPEVTGRLRAKVENYAIYSALFLSCTIAAVMDPPPAMDCERREFDGEYEKYRCEVAKRVAAYALIASVAMHFLAIILARAFVNALNECARESDVFRVFARGQGFLATYKCQKAFRIGSACTMVAIGAVSLEMIGWDAVVRAGKFILTRVYFNSRVGNVTDIVCTAARRVRDSHLHAHVALAVQQRKPGELLANRAGG